MSVVNGEIIMAMNLHFGKMRPMIVESIRDLSTARSRRCALYGNDVDTDDRMVVLIGVKRALVIAKELNINITGMTRFGFPPCC